MKAFCLFSVCIDFFAFQGSSKRRRRSFSGGHSSNEEGNDCAVDSPSGDGQSPSVRKQPKRVVKPRVYFDLVDYDSDLDEKAFSSSASPARKRGSGSRFSQGKFVEGSQWHLSKESFLLGSGHHFYRQFEFS